MAENNFPDYNEKSFFPSFDFEIYVSLLMLENLCNVENEEFQ
jgi:hypothetical protein